MWETLTFGSVNTSAYDVYVTGEQAFNAPARVYEMIDIPGRSGQLAIDGKRYENIEVSYPAGLFTRAHTDYREKIAAIRNALASQTGYQRLTDSYNPDEFRMAIYAGPFDTEPVGNLIASEFEINFNCKPQRYLTSGEVPEAFPRGDTNLVAYPFDETTQTVNGIRWTDNGDGTVTANGTATSISDFRVKRLASGTLVLGAGNYALTCTPTGGSRSTFYSYMNKGTASNPSNIGSDTGNGLTFSIDSADTTCGLFLRIMAGTTVNDLTFAPDLRTVGEGTSGTITNPTMYEAKPLLAVTGVGTLNIGDYSMVLTGSATQTVYIDCEIMEAWTLSGSTKINANDRVRYAGNEFPALGPGENALSWDSTITSLLITPRWWRL